MNDLSRLKQRYEGKAKKVFATSDPGLFIVAYKDDATAFNAQKKGTILNKGIVNNAVTAKIFAMLEDKGIPTHFIKKLSEREQLVKAVKIIPVEVIVRESAAAPRSA